MTSDTGRIEGLYQAAITIGMPVDRILCWTGMMVGRLRRASGVVRKATARLSRSRDHKLTSGGVL